MNTAIYICMVEVVNRNTRLPLLSLEMDVELNKDVINDDYNKAFSAHYIRQMCYNELLRQAKYSPVLRRKLDIADTPGDNYYIDAIIIEELK